jgi:hypothetical protein
LLLLLATKPSSLSLVPPRPATPLLATAHPTTRPQRALLMAMYHRFKAASAQKMGCGPQRPSSAEHRPQDEPPFVASTFLPRSPLTRLLVLPPHTTTGTSLTHTHTRNNTMTGSMATFLRRRRSVSVMLRSEGGKGRKEMASSGQPTQPRTPPPPTGRLGHRQRRGRQPGHLLARPPQQQRRDGPLLRWPRRGQVDDGRLDQPGHEQDPGAQPAMAGVRP